MEGPVDEEWEWDLDYKYRPLESGSIRLIRLLDPFRNEDGSSSTVHGVAGAQKRMDSKIKLKMIHVSLDRCPAYLALSYTWGNASSVPPTTTTGPARTTKRSSIICDGKSLSVTPNLNDALQRLRKYLILDNFYKGTERHAACLRNWPYYQEASMFWIDAICINQKDDAERSEQVKLKGSIYSRARRTIIWLGEYDEYTRNIRAFMEKLAQLKRTYWHSPNMVGELPGFTKEEKFNFEALLTRRWFGRSWVLQEVVLSKVCTVAIGDYAFEFKILQDMSIYDWAGTRRPYGLAQQYEHLRERDPLRRLIKSSMPLTSLKLVESTCDWIMEQRDLPRPEDLPDLFSFINMCRSTDCQDPRDRIYSIMSIAREFCQNGKLLLQPDYSKSVAQVYVEASFQIIQSRKDLAILTLINHGKGEDGTTGKFRAELPSWCPDYTDLTLSLLDRGSQRKPVWKFPNTQPSYALDASTRGLSVQGYRLDTIVDATTVHFIPPGEIAFREVKDPAMFGVPSICALIGKLDYEAQTVVEQKCLGGRLALLWKTLTMNFFSSDRGTEILSLSFLAQLLNSLASEWLVCFAAPVLDIPGVQELAQYASFLRIERPTDIDAKSAYAANFRREIEQLLEEDDMMAESCLPPANRVDTLLERCKVVDRSRGTISQAHASVWLDEMTKLRASIDRVMDINRVGVDLRQFLVLPDNWDDVVRQSQMCSLFTAKLRGACLFRTREHLLGLGGYGVVASEGEGDGEGDTVADGEREVWLLNGSYAPVVLKRNRKDGTYQFLGEVYVHGLMDGRELPACCRELRTVVLK